MKLRYAQFSQENLRIRFFFPKGIIDMNSTFKVVFNKARGALMVVNEVTSSVQAKGTKTVVAAAVATMIAGVAGTTMAAEWVEAPKDAATAAPSDWKFDKNAYLFSETNDGKDPTAFLGASEKGKTFTFDKKLWVKAGSDTTRATGLWAADGATIENTGTIYVTGGSSWKNHAMGAANGAKAINAGTIVAKNAYGMFIGTSKNGTETPTIQNDGRIVVEGQGAGFELGGAGVKGIGINNGTITVGEVFDKNMGKDEWAHGVLINTATNTFENNGTINATAEGTSAIEVKDGATTTTLNFGEKSDVNGLIHLAAGTVNMTFNGTQDELTIKTEQQANYGSNSTPCETLAVNLTLDKGANITLEDGQAATFETVELENSRLNASIWGADNTFKSVTVKENGIFNVTKLNSKSEGATENDQLLLARDTTWNLHGGKLYVAGTEYTGTLRIGSGKDKGSGLLNVSEGSALNLTRLEVQKSGTVNVNADGSITTETLHLSKGNVNVNGGSLTVTGDKGFTVFKGTENKAPALTLTNGTFTVDAGSLFKEQAAAETAADAKKTYVATDAAKVIKGTGTVNVTSKAFEYSLDELREGQKLLNTEGSSAIKLVLANGTLKLGENEKLDADSINGLNLAGHTGVAGEHANNAFKVTQTTTVGAIDFKAVTDKEATEIALGNSAALTLAGNGGDVFKNLGANVTKITTGDLVLGTAGNSGNVNVDTLKTEALTVAGDFTARAVEATTAKIDGILTANSVKTTDATDGAKVTGALVLTGNVKKDVSELTGKVTVTDRGVLTTNRAAGLAYAADYADEDLSVAYVDRQLKLAKGAEINVGEAPATGALAAAATTSDRTVNVNANGIYGIDAASFLYTGKPAAEADLSVFGNSTALNLNGGEVEILNITKLGQIDLGGAITNTANIDTDSIYVVVNDKGVDAATGVVTLSYNDDLVADKTVDARLKDAFTNGVGAKELGILSALDTPAFYDEETDKLTAAGNKALEQATGGNATAGVLNVAYDANAQVTDAIVRHQLSEHAGMGVWADVFYAKNEAKEIYGDFGYSADIYGGVLGFDYTAACGGTLGAALTVGTADADSEGGVLSTSLSSDFVGLSVYASKDFSGLNVKADLGYIDFSNDFTGLGDASDATTITFGVRGDFTAYQNGAFSVVPHMGLRYTRIDTDAVAFNDEQNMNVLEAPIGVKFAGTFEATGWKLVPSYDFTIVPQLGDKEVEAFGTAGDITILSGGLFNNVLGVEAVKDNMSFGLNASYGFGPDDRANTQVNANFRYHF